MKPVIYSVAMPLNRGGMGTIAWHACKGLRDADLLGLALAPEAAAAGELADKARDLPWGFRKIMSAMNRLRWHRMHDDFFDRWASTWITPGADFYGWLHQSLACIRACHEHDGWTAVDRGSVEPRLQRRWLAEEYKKHGLTRNPMHPLTVERMVKEADEADCIVAPSRLVADSYVAAGYKACKLAVNPLGVDLPVVPAEEKREPRDSFRFAFVGQLSIQKGLPGLLRVWKKLAPPIAELVLAGVIPPEESVVIEPLLRDTPGVKWDGHCHDVPALMRSCDAFVLPSAQDGFGLVVLEAMANGLPVIVSDRVGAQDCVSEGKSGFIFRFGDADALADRMNEWLNDPANARFMGAVARDAARKYSWEDYGKGVAKLCRDHGGQ